ncbi:MAG: ABC transporter permease, partial [Rhizobiaceae bacterium]|nr:ABC transporter permease [Rhizobiaceae bacterium]
MVARTPSPAILPLLLALLIAAPVAVGLAGAILPAFGYLPALGGTVVSLQPFRDLLAVPGLLTSAALGLVSGLATTLLSVLSVLLFA